MKRLRVSRHEAEACGDLGKGSETAAGGGGRDIEAEQPAEPATGEEGRGTTVAEASKEFSG